ncbi:MAG: ATP cone domain-containing protein [bacterium]|nr:ATP cone domain-containing protein [bacterium]MDZ4231817.1 ATP cone domain-containing protein [Candidatus Pacearchaeota archaeon]
MATEVIKRDGSRQPFDPEKLRRSIEAACQDADSTAERTKEVVEQVSSEVLSSVSERPEVSTSELGSMILGKLETVEPSAAQAWRKHEEEKGKAAA